MRINRTELIDQLRAEIVRRRQQGDYRLSDDVGAETDRESAYVAETADAWKQLADRIRLRLRQRAVITIADVPAEIQDRYKDTIAVFNRKKIDGTDVRYRPYTAHLERLIMVLEASPDEFITHSTLVQLGAAPLREMLSGR